MTKGKQVSQHFLARDEARTDRGPSGQARPGRVLALVIGASIDEQVACRIDYVFRVFCAVYGYAITTAANLADARLCYGTAPAETNDLLVPARYRADAAPDRACIPECLVIASRSLPCFFGTEDARPDWLGEAFYWISGDCERGIVERDAANRIPFTATVHHRCDLDPTVPYAALAFRGLNDALAKVLGPLWLAAPAKPWKGDGTCLIAATHDVDFLPITTLAAIKRTLKNALIAGLVYRDVRLAFTILATMAGKLARGKRPLHALPELIRMEAERDITSTCYFLCRQAHRRDANYSIRDERVQAVLHKLSQQGFEIGVHGSYTSLDLPGRLAEEYASLAEFGWQAVGSRQHWLRYQGGELFDALLEANAAYDCTVGYSQRLGFRSGACFPYPPYCFETESAYPLLELPMVMMNNSIYHQYKHCRREAQAGCRSLLETVREFGWGGVSILWHDTGFGGEQFPHWSGELYWDLKADDLWRSGGEVARIASDRFAQAGLLPR